MSRGLIEIKIYGGLKIDKILDKKGKFLKITKSQINIILLKSKIL